MIDFNLKEGEDLLTDDVALIIQQIDILFGTTPYELFGDPSYGSRYDTYLYELQISAEALKEEIKHDLTKINLMGFRPSVDVYLVPGTEREIALVEINLYKDTNTYKKVYKIT